MSFSAGDATGRKHTYAKGLIRMWTPVAMASSSKFPVALAIAGAVVDGHLGFDTPACDVFSWWTRNASDVRSRVTLRRLLSFTSGIVVADVAGGGLPCLMGLNASRYSIEECAQEIYTKAPFVAEPGTIWSYHSLHLQIAGAMAAKASGMTIKALLEKYLTRRLGMRSSFWIGYPNPHLAATMISTGNDYDKLLRSVLSYELLPKEVIDQMEKDYTAAPVRASNLSKDAFLLGTYGHYSMCTYFECVGQNWTDKCRQNGVHADPGAFGYWPLIDRTKGYYMQIVTLRIARLPAWVKEKYHIDSSLLAALPAMCTAPLRFGLQPLVEHALGQGEVSGASLQETRGYGRESSHLLPGGLPTDLCQYVRFERGGLGRSMEEFVATYTGSSAEQQAMLVV